MKINNYLNCVKSVLFVAALGAVTTLSLRAEEATVSTALVSPSLVSFDVKPDMRLEMHNDGRIPSVEDATQRVNKQYTLVRLRLQPELNFKQDFSIVSNIDLVEANAGAALTQTKFPGFSGLDNGSYENISEKYRYRGAYGKNVEFFAINYAFLNYTHKLFTVAGGIIPFGFGYGAYYNDALGADAYLSPIEMDTLGAFGKISGLLLGINPYDFNIRVGLNTPSSAKEGSIIDTLGDDRKILVARVDKSIAVADSQIKLSLHVSRGTGRSVSPFSPTELGLFGEYKNSQLSLGAELWRLLGQWGATSSSSGMGSLIRANYSLSSVNLGLDALFASGENNSTTNESELFQMNPDFSFAFLLFRQVYPNASENKVNAFDIFNGRIANSIALKPNVTVQYDNVKATLALITALRAANSATSNETFLGNEIDLDVKYFFEKNLFVRVFGGLLLPGKALELPAGSPNASKVGLGLYLKI